jgi:hypothetical protein
VNSLKTIVRTHNCRQNAMLVVLDFILIDDVVGIVCG